MPASDAGARSAQVIMVCGFVSGSIASAGRSTPGYFLAALQVGENSDAHAYPADWRCSMPTPTEGPVVTFFGFPSLELLKVAVDQCVMR
jgi:hypothetical protein